MLKKLLLLTLICSGLKAGEQEGLVLINPEAVRNRTGDQIYLCLEDRQFYVANKTQETITQVNLAFSDTLARKLRTPEDIDAFLKADGNITVKQCSNGDYILNTSIPLRGGGPVVAGLFYGLTKTVAYLGVTLVGTAAVATATATLPASGPVVFASAAVAKGALVGGAYVTGAGTLGAAVITMGAPAAAATIATATAATATTFGSFAAFFMAIEAASSGAAAFGMVCCPW